MASGNVIITKTVNRTIFTVDSSSYKKTVDKIRSVGKEWDKVASKMKPLRLKFEENGYTKARRKQQDEAAKAAMAEAKAKAATEAKAAKAQLVAERKLQTIRAKAIRFSTSAANANVTPAQRAGHLQEFGQLKVMDANDAMYGQDTTAGGNLKKDSPLGKLWDFIHSPDLPTNPNFAKPEEKTGWVSSYSNPGYVPPAPTITAPQLKVDMAGNGLFMWVKDGYLMNYHHKAGKVI